MTERTSEDVVKLATAFISTQQLEIEQIPQLIESIREGLFGPKEPKVEPLVPAVPIKKSIQQDYIICLEDGKKMKLLRRHLKTTYNMTPEEYRERWNLPYDYPMVAPSYAEKRKNIAIASGLGSTGKKPVDESAS